MRGCQWRTAAGRKANPPCDWPVLWSGYHHSACSRTEPPLHRGHAPLVFRGDVTGASLEALGAPTRDERPGQRALEERSCDKGTLSHSAVTFMFLKSYIIIDRQLVQHLALGRGGGWAVFDTQRSLWARTKTARVAGGAHVALTRPPLSRFALHFARLSCYLDLRSVREQRVRRSHSFRR